MELFQEVLEGASKMSFMLLLEQEADLWSAGPASCRLLEAPSPALIRFACLMTLSRDAEFATIQTVMIADSSPESLSAVETYGGRDTPFARLI